MKVYHGSIIEVAHPLVSLGRRNLDFGKGFYVTDIKEQAQRWAERMGRRKLAAPIVSIYNFEVEKARECCRYLRFKAYDKAWLDFIVANRKGLDFWKWGKRLSIHAASRLLSCRVAIAFT